MEISSAGSLRFPGEGSSSQGKAGPKPRSKDVGDGLPVHIPAPPSIRLSNGGTQEGRSTRRRSSGAKPVGNSRAGKSTLELDPRSECQGSYFPEVTNPTLPRKSPSEDRWRPYRKPTQVGG